MSEFAEREIPERYKLFTALETRHQQLEQGGKRLTLSFCLWYAGDSLFGFGGLSAVFVLNHLEPDDSN